jgi:cytochrome c5
MRNTILDFCCFFGALKMRYIRSSLVVFICLATITIADAADPGTSEPSGKTVFEANCANCHTGGFGGFFTGAPKVGKRKHWKSLTPKGVDALTASTLAGVGKMAPRGECTACTDEEIRAAVEYMLEKSQ